MKRERKRKRIALFGHFDSTNFGNESTLQAILYHLRCFRPDAEITCICTGPEVTAASYHINAVPLTETFVKSSSAKNTLVRMLRKVIIGLPNEVYCLIKGFTLLKRIDVLIIPGTGLLTDAYGLFGWGPYTLLRWSLIAKACRCKLLFVSIGAGPVYTKAGKYLVRAILSLADFRSYRDNSTRQYLTGIGFHADNDRIYPDLAFSLPESLIVHQSNTKNHRSVVGLGVMTYAGSYSVAEPRDTIFTAYLENLVAVVCWLLAHEYDVRLLIGDVIDTQARQQFRALLRERLPACGEEHIIDEPICSSEDLLSQICATDIVVATRFHNVLFALMCNKPTISISFHHKCDSLMSAMGLSEYCLDINNLNAEKLLEKFHDLETNADKIKPLVAARARQFRKALDEQYKLIFNDT